MSRSARGLLQRTVAMVPALLLGMAVGVGGGAWAAGAMDATPYGETDLNTISRQSQEAGNAEGWKQAQEVAAEATARLKDAHAEQVEKLEDELKNADRSAKKTDKKLREQDKKLREQGKKLAKVQSSLAETAAALQNATSRQVSGSADAQAIEGTIRSTWVLRGNDKPWPRDCSKPLQTYGIRVTAGTDATVAEGQLVGAEMVKRKETKKDLTLVCSMTYRASVPAPLGDGYKVVVLDQSKNDATVESKAASSAALGNGSAPAITVTR